MPEYRTTDGTEADDSGGGFDTDQIVETVVKRIQSDPQSQAAVAKALNENYGVPPDVLAPFLPAVRDALNAQNEAAEPPAEQPTQAEPEKTPMPQKSPDPTDSIDPLDHMTAADVENFLDEVLTYIDGDDMTVQEMRDYVADNPGIVDTALKMA